jgi:WD40 repeat protein
MVYVVQNLNDESILSLEWVDGAEAKVLRRATLDTAVISLPSAVGLGKENGLVALGSEDGAIYLLDQEKGKLLHSWQAGGEAIIGLAFTADDKSLVSLDAQGLIQVWGID